MKPAAIKWTVVLAACASLAGAGGIYLATETDKLPPGIQAEVDKMGPAWSVVAWQYLGPNKDLVMVRLLFDTPAAGKRVEVSGVYEKKGAKWQPQQPAKP